jgi:hypothetical protein
MHVSQDSMWRWIWKILKFFLETKRVFGKALHEGLLQMSQSYFEEAIIYSFAKTTPISLHFTKNNFFRKCLAKLLYSRGAPILYKRGLCRGGNSTKSQHKHWIKCCADWRVHACIRGECIHSVFADLLLRVIKQGKCNELCCIVWLSTDKRPLKNQKLFKILHHIEFYGTCIEH